MSQHRFPGGVSTCTTLHQCSYFKIQVRIEKTGIYLVDPTVPFYYHLSSLTFVTFYEQMLQLLIFKHLLYL